MRFAPQLATVVALLARGVEPSAHPIAAAGQPAQLDVRVAGAQSIRVTLGPVSFKDEFPINTALAEREYTRQPSFDFNPEVFKRDPKAVLADMHARHVKVVVHMVPWDRDKLPTLHGTIPARSGETLDASHIQSYWRQHVPLVNVGIDAFWPDEGDWFDLFERIKRHQLYYQGHLSTHPNVRPWSLQRNGYPGIAQ